MQNAPVKMQKNKWRKIKRRRRKRWRTGVERIRTGRG
jgi:hypothetical protein